MWNIMQVHILSEQGLETRLIGAMVYIDDVICGTIETP